MLRCFLVRVFCLCLAVHLSRQQVNPQTKVFEYYMDSHAECGKTFELGLTPATVYGKGAVQASDGPLSCTITLSTDGIREHRRFTIELVTGFISSQGVNFYIYDGQWTQDSSAQTLASFSYFSPPPANMQRLITSGGFVTLSLTRDSPDLYGYGFVVSVTPTPADISNPNNCDQGAGYGCESYYYNPVITKSEVIYIIAAIFAVILVIVVPVVLIYCYRRQAGLNRRWQERRLKDGAPKTAATSLNGSLRSVPLSSRPWQSDISKQPFASVKKSPASSRRWSRPPTDDESVFDDYPKKPPPPPPPYEEHDRYRVARNGRDYPPRRRDNYRDRQDSYDRDDYDRDRDRRYRERHHSDSSNNTSRYSDEKNDSFVQADDDHPQESFVERIIEPRVRPRSARKVNRKRGNNDDEESNSSTEKVNPVKKANSETQCNRESDSEGSPETESETENSQEELVSSQSEEEEEHNPRTDVYAQPDKARKKDKKKNKTTADKPMAAQPPPVATNLPQAVPGVPYQPMPGMVLQRPPLQGYPMMPPNPALGFMPRVGQIVRPAYPVPNQYHPAGPIQPPKPAVTVPMTGQSRAQVQNLPVSRPAGQQLNNSGEAPKYSYLVNRGYETGRTSPVSSTTSYSHQSYVLDDSAGHIDLGSGVELMKRTTEV